MDEKLLKKEIDTYLEPVKLSDQMKRNIRLACSKEAQERENKHMLRRFFRYKKVSVVMLLLLIGSGTMMAMDYTFGLGLFFNQGEIDKVIDKVQYVDASSQNQNVKMEVKEVLNQGHGAVATVQFTNLGDEPWTRDVVCRKIEFIKGESDYYTELSEGILSSDGKHLTYYIQTDNHSELFSGSEITIEAENLMKRQSIEKEIKIPLKDFKVTELGWKVEADIVAEAKDERKHIEVWELLERRVAGGKTEVISEEYPSVFLKGIAVLNLKGDERYKEEHQGIVLYTRGDKVPIAGDDSVKTSLQKRDMELARPYTEAEIIELTDTRTGKVYKAEKFDYYGVYGAVLFEDQLSYFPNVTKEQIPYLEATKVVYDKQDILVEDTWKVDFKIDGTKIKKWDTDIEVDKTNFRILVDEVYLTTSGIQLRERTIHKKTDDFYGYFNSYWLDIILIDNQNKEMKLKNIGIILDEGKDGKDESYILTYKNCDEHYENDTFIDVSNIKKIMINGYEIDCQK